MLVVFEGGALLVVADAQLLLLEEEDIDDELEREAECPAAELLSTEEPDDETLLLLLEEALLELDDDRDELTLELLLLDTEELLELESDEELDREAVIWAAVLLIEDETLELLDDDTLLELDDEREELTLELLLLELEELALDSELWDQSEREIDTTKFIEARLEGAEETTTTPKAVLQVARKNHQGLGRTTHETSPHLHISKKARLSKSPNLLSAQSTPLSHEQRMAENSRLRARQAPKPFSDEMSRALAIMDQEIRDLAQTQPKKRGRGRPPKNSSGKLVDPIAVTG